MSARWVVVPYRVEWPGMFEDEAVRLRAIFGSDARIEHVGSTAVPGLSAKPILDILVGVTDLKLVAPRGPALVELGYHSVPEYEAELPERRYFRKPLERPRTHHLHVVVVGTPFWSEHLLFRDTLRQRPELVREYGRPKQRLAEECSAKATPRGSPRSSERSSQGHRTSRDRPEGFMLYMIVEHFRGGDPVPVFRRFRDRGRLAPEGLRYVTSWVTEDLAHCYQVMECDDRALLDEWIGHWQDLVEFEVVPVMTSAEAVARVSDRPSAGS